MSKNNITFTFKYNFHHYLTHFFIITPLGIKPFKKNSNVLILDSTYKINQFSMPLLYVVGCTDMGTMFQVCLYFMRNEKEKNNQWAMKQLRMSIDKEV